MSILPRIQVRPKQPHFLVQKPEQVPVKMKRNDADDEHHRESNEGYDMIRECVGHVVACLEKRR